MGNTRNTGFLQNAIKVSDTGAITFVSGSTTLATLNTTGQLSGSSPVVFAATSSYADAFTVAGTLTAQTLVVQTITSSVDFVTGSTRFGSIAANTHVFTGSVNITGSLTGVGATFNTNGDNLTLNNASGQYTTINFRNGGVNKAQIYWDNSANRFYVSDNLYFNTSGAATFVNSVGIGGASPTYRITVYNASNGTTAAFGGTARGIRIDNDGTFSSGRTTIYGVDNTFYGSYQPLSIEASTLALQVVTGGNVGIGTTSPTAKLHLKAPSNDQVLRFEQQNDITSQYYFNIDSAVNGTLSLVTNYLGGNVVGFTQNRSGNVGIGTTNPSAKLHNRGSFITETGDQYGEFKSFVFQSVFNNPTINLLTVNSTTAYAALIIKVTVYQNTVSSGLCNIHVGYANWAANPYPSIIKGISGPTIQVSFGGGTNVGTLSWSGNTLQYTSNRMTNYDGYVVNVEWGSNTDHNVSPTYG
jgi:hypothetical protein